MADEQRERDEGGAGLPGSRPAPTLDGEAEDLAGDEQDDALRAVQAALLKEIGDAVSRVEQARFGETTREHLEILRSLLSAQVTAYLGHFVSGRATLHSRTSAMYAGEVGPPGVLSITFRGLLEDGVLTAAQAATLAQHVGDRRTLLIFGDRATGKSTLLNALFDLVSVDERCLAVERGPDLPALRERSFCVRLRADAESDIPGLFAKARRMSPDRLVVGEMHAAEIREFFDMLAGDDRVGGLATLRATSVRHAVDTVLGAYHEDHGEARAQLTAVKPVFVHMHSDENGRPRLAALWSVTGLTGGELALEEVEPGLPPHGSPAAAL